DRHLAADPRGRVRRRRRRREHRRGAARGPLRRGAARDLHRPAGGRGGGDRGTVQRDRPPGRRRGGGPPPRRLRRPPRVAAPRTAAFDATDPDALARFFDGLATPIDHLMVSGRGPYYAPLAETDFAEVRKDIDQHLLLAMQVAIHAVGRVRPGGSLIFIS